MSRTQPPLLAFLIALAAAGCSGWDRIDSWPILYTEPETDRLPGRVEFLGPLGEVLWKDSTVQWGLKPLFSVRNYSDIPLDERAQFKVPFFAPPAILTEVARRVPPRSKPGEGKSAHQILALYPFFKHESCSPLHRTFFFPLYYNVRDESEPGDWWHHWALFPIYLGGNSAKRGPYHALFPIGGWCKNILGRDRMDFVLFPLFLHSVSEDKLSDKGPRHSYTLLWPFLNYTTGGGRTGWYFWPLIGRMHREPDPPRWFFLWPFFWYTEPAADKDPATTTGSAFFPFIGWQTQADTYRLNILWPLFSYAHNRKTGRTDYVAPWPIFRLGSGPDYSRLQFWPLAGYVNDAHVHRWYAPWPLFRREWRETDSTYMSGWSALIIYRSIYEQRDLPDRGTISTRESACWPLWYYKKDEDDNSYFCSLELRFKPDAEGIDRFYSWIWRIFEHETRTFRPSTEPARWRSTRALWSAFRYDRDEQSSFLRIFPLFTARRAAGQFTSLEALVGLFGFVDKPHARTYRIFFVPWTVHRADSP